MSFTARCRVGEVTVPQGGTLQLDATSLVMVPELGSAVINHGLVITEMDSVVLLVRKPGMMMSRGLIIDQGPVELGDVITPVFNLWPTNCRIKRGDVVSYLLCL